MTTRPSLLAHAISRVMDWGLPGALLAAVLVAAIVGMWPKSYRVDAEFYCRGWRVGYVTAYCGHDETCHVRAPNCPDVIPKRIRGETSLVAGVKAGEAAGYGDAGYSPGTPDSPWQWP